MAKIKETVPFTYDDIYKDISKRFIELGYDAPYDGSNIAALTSILSYSLSSFNFNTAVNINENILHLARKRDNVLQDARILSYEASKVKSAIVKITLEFTRTGVFTIPKHTQFNLNGLTFTYFGDDIVQKVNAVGDSIEIELKEGTLLLASANEFLNYRINEKFEYIDIPFSDVEDDGCEVLVTYYDDFGSFYDSVVFKKRSLNLVDIKDNFNNFYIRKDDINTGNCRLYFKIGSYGNSLPSNARIRVNVLRSSGIDGNFDSLNSASIVSSNVAGFAKIDLTKNTNIFVQRGQNFEDIESIKNNAPLLYNSASRAVTVYDYGAIAKTHNSVEAFKTWGGEDEYPIQKGELYFSIKPKRVRNKIEQFEKEVDLNANTYVYSKVNSSTNTPSNLYNIDSKWNSDIQKYPLISELTSSSVSNGVVYNNGIIDLIDKYNLPALGNNIKNPIYIDTDLRVNVKRYPNNLSQIEVRNQIIETIEEYFKSNSNFDSEFVISNLIRYVDTKLGISNGVEIKPYFSINLNKNNKTQKFEEIKDFRTDNCFYSQKYDEITKNLIVSLNISALSEIGDIITFYFNKTIVIDGVERKEFKYTITPNDVSSNAKTFYFKDNSVVSDDISVVLRSYSGSSLIAKNINLYNFKNKNIFYNVKTNKETSELKIFTGNYARIGDKIYVYGLYGNQNVPQILKTFTLTYDNIQSGFVIYTDIHRADFAGVVTANSYKVIFESNKVEKGNKNNDLYENQILGLAKLTENEAKQATQDQNNVFKNFDLDDVYYNIQESGDSKIVNIWVGKKAKVNDTIEITANGETQVVSITQEMLNQKVISVVLRDTKLAVTLATYESQNGTSIGIYPAELLKLNRIIPVENDSLGYYNRSLSNITEYNPIKTYDRIPKIKKTELQFFINYENKFDVRNLIYNYATDKGQISVDLPNNSILTYEFPYIILKNYRSPIKTNFTLNYTDSNGAPYSENIDVFVKEAKYDIRIQEGPGGVYIYLDLPPEGIFDSSNKIITDNLPILYEVIHKDFGNIADIKNFSDTKPYFNKIEDSKWDSATKEFKSKVTSLVGPDFELNDANIKNLIPYIIDKKELSVINISKVSYIKFPIKDFKTSKIVGVYTIFNGRIPYIRIKLQNSVVNSNRDFILKYPSDNFKLIRNSLLKLRSITFDDLTDYEVLKDFFVNNIDDFIERK